MASKKLILTFVRLFIIINCSRNVFAEMTEDTDGNLDLKYAIQKIKELQKIVLAQDKRISMLERRPEESEVRSEIDFQKIVKEQNDRIAQLEARIQELESAKKVEEYAPIETKEYEIYSESKGYPIRSYRNIDREACIHEVCQSLAFKREKSIRLPERLLSIQPTTVPLDSVAFYAYLSSSIPASVAHRIIAFDTVITNVGNAYHPHMGTFIAPKSGLYVFTWTIRLYGQTYHTTELVVNNNIVNALYFNPNGQIDGVVSSTTVVNVNQGDDVLIRTSSDYHNGEIKSGSNGRSSFAGWRLM